MPKSTKIENLNKNPLIEILDDHKYLAEMKSADGKNIVQIGFPKKDFCDRDYYPVFVNHQEIVGTGTTSFGQAITWGETYLRFTGEPDFIEGFISDIDAIDRKTSFMREALLRIQRMADEKQEDK